MSWGSYWAPYVPVAQKRAMAVSEATKRAKSQKRGVEPEIVQGRVIAKSFWGKAWCDNLAAYQDYANRLPRGATYLRNGSVVDMVILPKTVEAIVAGSEPYQIKIDIAALEKKRWASLRKACSQSIDSLIDLLAGKFSDGVMKRLTDKAEGLFPSPREIKMSCSCPDYSRCCKHLAAVMYAIGARLDRRPELLFLLRGVDHQELVSDAVASTNLQRELAGTSDSLAGVDLESIFGIELDSLSDMQHDTSKKGAGRPRRSATTKSQLPTTKKRSARPSAVAEPRAVTIPASASKVKKKAAKKTSNRDAATKSVSTKNTAKKKAAAKKAAKKKATTKLAGTKQATKKKAVKKGPAKKK